MARDQTQPGSFPQERKEPGNEVGFILCRVFSLGLWVLYSHLIHLCDLPSLSVYCAFWVHHSSLPVSLFPLWDLLPLLAFQLLWLQTFNQYILLCQGSGLYSSQDIVVKPVRSVICTQLYCQLICRSLSAMSSLLASRFRSVTKVSKVSPGCCRLRSNWTAAVMGFFLTLRCVLNFSATRSSISFSLALWRFSPVLTCTISHWNVRYILSSPCHRRSTRM